MWLSTCNTYMKIVHIVGKSNPVAELLSRKFTVPNNVQKLQQLVYPVTWISTTQDLLFINNEFQGVHPCYLFCTCKL